MDREETLEKLHYLSDEDFAKFLADISMLAELAFAKDPKAATFCIMRPSGAQFTPVGILLIDAGADAVVIEAQKFVVARLRNPNHLLLGDK